jgi:hypothetical protein
VIYCLRAAGAGVLRKEANPKTNHHEPNCKSRKYYNRDFDLAGSLAIPGYAVRSVRSWIHGGIEGRRIGLVWGD